MEAFTGERIEEPRGVADEQPSGPGTARHPMTERPRARDTVHRLAGAPPGGVLRDRLDGGDDPPGEGRRPRGHECRPPRRPEDDADVDPSTGHRRDTDVAVVEKDHPCVARDGAVRLAV